MQAHRPRVLFVGHDASRSGAPIQARTFLRWLVATGTATVDIHLQRGGPLVDDLRRLGPTVVEHRGALGRIAATSSIAGQHWRFGWRSHWPSRPVDLVLANTLAALPAAIALAGSAPVACWVHELHGVADRLIPVDQRARLVASVDRWIAAGSRVEEMLVQRWGINRAQVHAVDPFLEGAPLPAESDAFYRRGAATEAVVLGAGSMVSRKGVDAFVATMAVLAADRPEFQARWVGGDPTSPYARQTRFDVDAAGLSDRLHLFPEVADLAGHWPAATVFLHTAREDPAPLVVIEAAAHGLPVVTWDTGGAADLLRHAELAELVAPAGDVIGLSRRVASLLDDPSYRHNAGARLRAAAAPLVADLAAPRTWTAMTSAAGAPPIVRRT